jgi:hypothetical protein
MRSPFLCGTILAAAINSFAGEAETRIALCLEVRTLVSNFAVERAKSLTSRIYSEVGFQVEWNARAECAKAGSIHIRIDAEAPERIEPDVLAYALPYGGWGTCIHIFYDRIAAVHHDGLLGHVIAHEVAHVLEGIVRHSSTGLLKPKWDSKDYFEMHHHALPFAEEDVELLHLGLQRRTARALAATR